MTRKTKIAALIGAALLALSLTGCEPQGAEQSSSTRALREESITLHDGRQITCVVYASGYQGGLSCDWSSR